MLCRLVINSYLQHDQERFLFLFLSFFPLFFSLFFFFFLSLQFHLAVLFVFEFFAKFAVSVSTRHCQVPYFVQPISTHLK